MQYCTPCISVIADSFSFCHSAVIHSVVICRCPFTLHLYFDTEYLLSHAFSSGFSFIQLYMFCLV